MQNSKTTLKKNRLTKKSLAGWVARLFGHTTQRDAGYEPSFRFLGRLSSDQISDFLEEALGRRLTQIEVAALDEGFRPQGLLDPDDCYTFWLASPRYFGTFAPEIEVFGTAVGGYADGEGQLKLAETVSVHWDDGIEVVDDELVADF